MGPASGRDGCTAGLNAARRPRPIRVRSNPSHPILPRPLHIQLQSASSTLGQSAIQIDAVERRERQASEHAPSYPSPPASRGCHFAALPGRPLLLSRGARRTWRMSPQSRRPATST
jgi:hypothetical protein